VTLHILFLWLTTQVELSLVSYELGDTDKQYLSSHISTIASSSEQGQA